MRFRSSLRSPPFRLQAAGFLPQARRTRSDRGPYAARTPRESGRTGPWAGLRGPSGPSGATGPHPTEPARAIIRRPIPATCSPGSERLPAVAEGGRGGSEAVDVPASLPARQTLRRRSSLPPTPVGGRTTGTPPAERWLRASDGGHGRPGLVNASLRAPAERVACNGLVRAGRPAGDRPPRQPASSHPCRKPRHRGRARQRAE